MGNLDDLYRRVLYLKSGSNFRDFGDYPTLENKRIQKGIFFRSASLNSIVDKEDLDYLKNFKFKTVIDLRSTEEQQLQPDTWVLEQRSINYQFHEYSFLKIMEGMNTEKKVRRESYGGSELYYRVMHKIFIPQLKLFFKEILNEKTPIILHCSGGQDRTGFVVAIMLKLFNVSNDLIYEDYLLSTDLRNPELEFIGIDLHKEAEKNAFAKFMVSYVSDNPRDNVKPLRNKSGVPFIKIALDEILSVHGSVESYVINEIGLSQKDVSHLRHIYTTENYIL